MSHPSETEGYFFYRTTNNPAEKIFQETFSEDKWQSAIGNLLSRRKRGFLSLEEEKLVATVIQWLGSPVGASFLRDVFEKMGITLIKEPLEDMLTSESEYSRAMGKKLLGLAKDAKYKSEIDKKLIELYGVE